MFWRFEDFMRIYSRTKIRIKMKFNAFIWTFGMFRCFFLLVLGEGCEFRALWWRNLKIFETSQSKQGAMTRSHLKFGNIAPSILPHGHPPRMVVFQRIRESRIQIALSSRFRKDECRELASILDSIYWAKQRWFPSRFWSNKTSKWGFKYFTTRGWAFHYFLVFLFASWFLVSERARSYKRR